MNATLKVTSALKPSDDEVYLFLASGAVAHINAANTTARVTLADGATFSVVEDEAAARDFVQRGGEVQFTAERPPGMAPLEIRLGMPGRHNALNALAAFFKVADLE